LFLFFPLAVSHGTFTFHCFSQCFSWHPWDALPSSSVVSAWVPIILFLSIMIFNPLALLYDFFVYFCTFVLWRLAHIAIGVYLRIRQTSASFLRSAPCDFLNLTESSSMCCALLFR
jgi:hypothetical protein